MQKLLSGEQLHQGQWRQYCHSRSIIIKILPLQLIDPQSTDIIDHGASLRQPLDG